MRNALMLLLGYAAIAAAAGKPAQFFARRNYPVLAPEVTVADTNGDNILDVIALGYPTITTYFGTGNGTFRQGPASNSGLQLINGGVPLDWNGDGTIDRLGAGTVNGYGGPGGLASCLVMETAHSSRRSSTKLVQIS
jgi:hypothetical protein